VEPTGQPGRGELQRDKGLLVAKVVACSQLRILEPAVQHDAAVERVVGSVDSSYGVRDTRVEYGELVELGGHSFDELTRLEDRVRRQVVPELERLGA
jgi:hypothetical protein